MPTGIDASAPAWHTVGNGLTRRAWLARLTSAGAAVCLSVHRTVHASDHGRGAIQVAACWNDAQGRHFAGWLGGSHGGPWHIQRAVELPTRGHGLTVLPDGALVVVARRPGDWLLRLSAAGAPQWQWAAPGRVFCGHAMAAPDGQHLLTTELDTDRGTGVVGVRHLPSLLPVAEYDTHGLDPHSVVHARSAQLAWAPSGVSRLPPELDNALWVANGGIATSPEAGRAKQHLDAMDSSLVCLDVRTGDVLGQWRVPDQRLSLRHLAWACSPSTGWTLGVAVQAEHGEPQARDQAPLLATLEWQGLDNSTLNLATAQPALAGYGGDVAVWRGRQSTRFVVSATRGHQLACYDMGGRFVGATPWPEAGALVAMAGQGWAAGRMGWRRWHARSAEPAQGMEGQLRVDNHAVGLPTEG